MAENKISVQNRDIDVRDLPKIAEQLMDEYARRKDNRSDLESRWDEVDRQLRVEADTSHKNLANNKPDPDKKWLPEVELPLQSETLEMLVADCRRELFPRGREWFAARAALTDKYLNAFMKAETPITNEKGGYDGSLNQDNADQIAKSAISHYHRQYDLRAHVDLINSEALSYGFGVGRVVPVEKRILGHTMSGLLKKAEIPILIPRSARNVYLDDSAHAVMNEGVVIGPNIIEYSCKRLADLRAAALTDDSYIPQQMSLLETNENGEVELVELEGDLVYEKADETIVVRDVRITAAKGTGKKTTFGIIRQRPSSGCTYIVFDYQIENTRQRAGTAPLLKGAPVNRIAAMLMNGMLESGALKNAPPIGYSRDDPYFASTGGPKIHPNALWENTEGVEVFDKVGGDPSVFLSAFQAMVAMYYDVTGVNPPRLGAQTKSHTTAYAKDAELSQGAVRTVDYVDQVLEGPLPRFLEMEYRFAKKNWTKQVVYCEAWKDFIELERAHLPDIVQFEAFGAGAPAEEMAAQQQMLNAIQTALQVDMIAIQLGKEPKMDHGKIIEMILRKGGVHDLSEVVTEDTGEPAPMQGNGQLPGVLSATPQ